MSVIVKEVEFKGNTFYNVYVTDCKTAWSFLKTPKPKYGNESVREFTTDLFITDEDRETLEDLMVNKTFAKVGVDKNKKRKIKYSNEDYPDMVGLNGFKATLNEYKKDGTAQKLDVVIKKEDGTNEPFDGIVGNGSTVSVKLFGYRPNNDPEEAMNLQLKVVQVTDLVEIESNGDYDPTRMQDDVLGIDMDLGGSATTDTPQAKTAPPASPDFDDDIPF